jgi:hypothetical protein
LDDTRYAVTLVETGDKDGYERFRQGEIKHFGGTKDPIVAERTVKNSLLVPGDDSLLATLVPFAEIAAKSVSNPNSPREQEPWGGAIAWRCVSLALMDYRRGHYADSVNWCKRCLGYGDDKQLARVATIHAIYAMSYYQLGQPENARAELAQSREIIESKFSDGADVGNGGHGFWFDWELGRVLEREAILVVGEQKAQAPVTARDRD